MKKRKSTSGKKRLEVPGKVKLVTAKLEGEEENENIKSIARIINGILEKNSGSRGQKDELDFLKTIEDVIGF